MMRLFLALRNRLKPPANRNLLKRIPKSPGARFEVDNWSASECILRKIIPIVGTHPYPLSELQLMVAGFCHARPSLVFDWGTHIGKSARIFSEASRWFSIPTHIHTIDLPPEVKHQEHPHQHVGRLIRNRTDVTQHFGDGVSVAKEILGRTSSTKPSCLFFVDGDHSFASVSRELEAIYGMAPQAIIILHDTLFQTVDSGYNVGPALAIEEFLVSHTGQFQRIDMATGLPGMTLLCPV